MNRERRVRKPTAVHSPDSSMKKEKPTKLKEENDVTVLGSVQSQNKTMMGLTGESLVAALPDRLFIKSRLPSFVNWPFKHENDVCSVRKMVVAGFICTGTEDDPSAAECVFCGKEMIFDSTDDPWEEHKSHCPGCPFVKLDKVNEASWSMQDLVTLSVACMGENANRKLTEDNDQVKEAADELVKMVEKKL